MRRYLLYAAAYGMVGVLIGLGMAYYTKDIDGASLILNPNNNNGNPHVVPEPPARERMQQQAEPEPIREETN